MKKFSGTLLMVLLVASISVISLSETPMAKAQALPKVRVGYIPFHYYTIWEYAKDQGWDKEIGIDIELKFYSSGGPEITGFTAHDIDIGVFAFTPFMVATSKGVDIKLIGIIQNAIGMTVVVTQPKIKSMEELKGGKVGFARATNFELVFREVAKAHGLKIEDFEVLNLAAPDVYAAMAAGKIDGACTDIPVAWTLQQEYKCNIVGGGFELWEKVVIPDVMCAVEGFAKENPLLTVKTMAVYYRVQKYFKDNPDFAVKWITDTQNRLMGSKQPVEASKASLEKIKVVTPQDNMATYFKRGHPMNVWDAILNVGKTYIDYKIITTIPDPEKVVETRYMDTLAKTSWDELKATRPGAEQVVGQPNFAMYAGIVVAIVVIAAVSGYYLKKRKKKI